MISLDRKLDRLRPPDWEHVRKFPLADVATPPRGVPVVLGINWYTDFDNPMRIGNDYFVAKNGITGTIRGGHCVCLKPGGLKDPTTWWEFYNQGNEGACVAFGESRCMSLLNRREYDPWPLYKIIEQPGGGAYVRDGLEVFRTGGPFRKRHPDMPYPQDGISAYRWALSVAEVHQTLHNSVADRLGCVPILNSWGKDYPHIVWLPDSALERLLQEEGEAAIVTDR